MSVPGIIAISNVSMEMVFAGHLCVRMYIQSIMGIRTTISDFLAMKLPEVITKM